MGFPSDSHEEQVYDLGSHLVALQLVFLIIVKTKLN
jgi:hypothetical protein